MTETGLQRRVNPRRMRGLQRLVHLLAAGVLLVYVYGGSALGSGFSMAVRWVALPILVLSGVALWKWTQLRKVLRQRGVRV